MAKSASDAVHDGTLDIIADSDRIFVNSAEPTNYTEASSTFALAEVTVTAGAGNGDFTIANGDTNGRKVTVTAQSSITVDTTGTATHISICKSTGTLLRVVTTCTSQALTAGNTVNIPAFKYENADPT